MDIKKKLTKVNKEVESLSRKLAKLIIEADRLQKAKPKATKSKAKKKALTKKPSAKKSTKQSATDKVLGILKRYKKPVGITTLEKRTGFNKRKINNILYKLNKAGKVESAGRGLYSIKSDPVAQPNEN